MSYVLPILILALFLFAIIKRAPVYDLFTSGAKKTVDVMLSLLPYIFAMTVLIELMKASELSARLKELLTPVLSFLGVPPEAFEMILFRPFTGSGAISILENVYLTYGVDSYPSRVASVISSSSETVVYMGAIYFASKSKNQGKAVAIALAVSLLTVLLSSWLCIVI